MTKYLLVVSGDGGDSDTVRSSYTLEQFPKEFNSILNKLKKNYIGWNWNNNWDLGDKDLYFNVYKDILTEEEMNYFNDMVPSHIHTIESVKVYEYIGEYTL